MDSNDIINKQCDEVGQAIQQVRNVFRSTSSLTTADLLHRFWDFQDCLHRLVNTLADHQAALSHLDHTYPRLISNAVDVLGFTAKTQVGSIPAVSHSCRAIQGLLLELQNLRRVTMLAPLA
jgi:hypothetical protein